MIIAVDFDGTLCEDRYPRIGNPRPGAFDAMVQLHKRGHYLILWTCRKGYPLLEAIQWCACMGIPLDQVNAPEPSNAKKFADDTRKIFADVYIDDRQIGGFPGWEAVIDYITKLEHEQNEH
jgi:Predicted hydrolases of the HAD superfamily